MKYIITESQYRLLNEETEEILEFPFKMFNNDWNFLQEYLEMIGNPPYKIIGNLDFSKSDIKTLGNLVGVKGYLTLRKNKTIESLGNLKSVGGDLYLSDTEIESLGNLVSVGGSLYMKNSYVLTLNNLKSVGENLDCRNYVLKSLGKLESVGGFLYVEDTDIDSLGNLQYVEEDFYLGATPLSRKTTEEEIRAQVTVGGLIAL